MPKIKTLFFSLFTVSLIIILAACGQGTNSDQESADQLPPVQEEDDEQKIEEEQSSEEENHAEEGTGEQEEVDKNQLAPSQEEGIKNQTVSLYFSDKDLNQIYRLEREIQVTTEEDVAKATLQAWIEGPFHPELSNIVPADVIIEYVQEKDGVAHVSFSQEIKNANLGSAGELALIEQITMMMHQFGYEQTQLLVEGHVEETLLGHMTTNEPIPAGDPADYERIN